MFKEVLFALDKPEKDDTFERVNKEIISNKYWNMIGLAITALVLTISVGAYSMMRLSTPPMASTFAVKKINGNYSQPEELITLPFPHQSYHNISGWMIDAILTIYTLSFDKFYQQAESAQYYFTPEGYKTYITALQANKIEKEIIENKLEVSIVPTQDPAYIGGGVFGNTEWWRYRVPAIASYYGGKEAVVQKYMIEVLILRVPSHQNHKGLAIAEFNMVPI